MALDERLPTGCRRTNNRTLRKKVPKLAVVSTEFPPGPFR
jgi:hypothetical protein